MTLQTRQLPVGDALWIARHKQLKYEYVLDFIVERKRVDDLWHSIKDNRYKQQKLRLMVSYSLDHFSAFFFMSQFLISALDCPFVFGLHLVVLRVS